MAEVEFLRGTKALEEAVRASLYESVLDVLGGTGTIFPIGDPKHGLMSATTFKTVGEEQVTVTPSEPFADFDTKPGKNGVVPVIDFNGTDEEADTPDITYFSRGDGSDDFPVSIGAWYNATALTGTQELMAKWDTGQTEWLARIGASGVPEFHVRDASAAVAPKRAADSALAATGTWYFVVFTYDGAGGASAMDTVTIYVDGAAVASTATNNGAYVAMENGTSLVDLGSREGTNLLNGKLAGGPLGPFFTQKELSADEILRLYEVGRRALDL